MLTATSGFNSKQPVYNSIVNALTTPKMNNLLDSFLPYVGSTSSNAFTSNGENTKNSNSDFQKALAAYVGRSINSSYNNKASKSNNPNSLIAMGGYKSSPKPYSFLGSNTSGIILNNDLETSETVGDKKNALLFLGSYFANKAKTPTAPFVKPDPAMYIPQLKPEAPIVAPPKPEAPIIPPPKPAPIAANQHTAYWGDPHVADADRLNQSNTKAVNFDVQGKGTYNLLTDKGVVLNAEHKEWGDPAANKDKGATPYVVGKVDLSLGDQKLALDDKGNATLNGKAIEKDKPVTATDGTVVKWDGNKLEAANANKGEYNMSFTLNKSTDEKGNNTSYIDTNITSTAKGVNSDGVMPTGILGEGFDADKNVRTELKHDQATYKVADGKTPEADAKEAPKADAKEAPKAEAAPAPAEAAPAPAA
jgi:hypothetical protein